MDPREALLETLRDPHAPTVGAWPLAPGWWGVIALVAVGLVALAVLVRRRRARAHRALAWQRAARAELEALRARLDRDPPAELLAAASVLARRTLLAVRPRTDVAPLAGTDWLTALDAAGGGTGFTDGPARVLAHAPFERAPAVSRDDVAAVLDALEGMTTELGRHRRGERGTPATSAVQGRGPTTPASTARGAARAIESPDEAVR